MNLPTFVTIAVLLAAAVATFFVLRTHEGFNVDRGEVAWARLPPDAARIDYYIGNVLEAYRFVAFDASEESFTQWLQTMQPDGTEPEPGDGSVMVRVRSATEGMVLTKMDVNGPTWTWRGENGRVQAGYDHLRGRGYYFVDEN